MRALLLGLQSPAIFLTLHFGGGLRLIQYFSLTALPPTSYFPENSQTIMHLVNGILGQLLHEVVLYSFKTSFQTTFHLKPGQLPSLTSKIFHGWNGWTILAGSYLDLVWYWHSPMIGKQLGRGEVCRNKSERIQKINKCDIYIYISPHLKCPLLWEASMRKLRKQVSSFFKCFHKIVYAEDCRGNTLRCVYVFTGLSLPDWSTQGQWTWLRHLSFLVH